MFKPCSVLQPHRVTANSEVSPYSAASKGHAHLLEGKHLHNRVPKAMLVKARLTLQDCLQLQGIIHRDIKPENILLTADKAVKLADFGLSIDASLERPVTRAGTLDYMAPEVNLRACTATSSCMWLFMHMLCIHAAASALRLLVPMHCAIPG